MLMLKQKWPEDVYFNGITVISQDRNWLTTPHIANVKFLIKKKFQINILCLILEQINTVNKEKAKMDMKW